MNSPIDMTVDGPNTPTRVRHAFSLSSPKIEVRETTVWKTTFLQPGIEIFNIPFEIRQGEQYVFVESPQWPSLKSYGVSVKEAIDNILSVIKDVANEYIFVDESELASDAVEFRRFLIRKLLV